MMAFNRSLDYLKSFVVCLVLAHHAVLAYAYYGRFDKEHYLSSTAPIIDHKRWLGFDVFVLFNDAFFMSLMFFLSGLFVLPALARKRKQVGAFLWHRFIRLGVPFLIAVTLLIPPAYYASFMQTGSSASLTEFWWLCFTEGPWPGGPVWFIWLLLAFNFLVAIVYVAVTESPRVLVALIQAAERRPVVLFTALVLGAALLYIPMVAVFGAEPWFAWGPVSAQTSRVLLYAYYFLFGVGIGAVCAEGGILCPKGPLRAQWGLWGLAALAAFGIILSMQLYAQELKALVTPRGWLYVYSFFFVVSCAASGIFLLALFMRFAQCPVQTFDHFGKSAYGIYVVHYVFILWLQYLLLPFDIPAIFKATIVFVATLLLSWACVVLFNKISIRLVVLADVLMGSGSKHSY